MAIQNNNVNSLAIGELKDSFYADCASVAADLKIITKELSLASRSSKPPVTFAHMVKNNPVKIGQAKKRPGLFFYLKEYTPFESLSAV